MYRDSHENPIPLSGNTTDLQAKGDRQSPSPAANTTRKPSANQTKRVAQKNKPASKQAKPQSTRRSAARPVNQPAGHVAKNTSRVANPKNDRSATKTPNSYTPRKSRTQPSKTTASKSKQAASKQGDRTTKKKTRFAKATKKNTRRNRPTQSSSTKSPASASGNSTTGVAVETHRVQPGDTFAMLAKNYYGSEKYTQYLLDHNRHIKSPTSLRVGDSLKIPPLPSGRTFATIRTNKSSRPAATKNAATRNRTARTYTVRPGDSFYAIAQNELGNASRWEELFKLNASLVNGDPKKLQVGQAIALPAR
jgi:hypothetical protein